MNEINLPKNINFQTPANAPDYKLFSAGQIAAGTFFGSILTGGFMLAANYAKLKDAKKANRRLLLSVVYFLLYVLTAVVFSKLPGGPWLAVVIGFIFIFKSEFKREQKDKYYEHLARGGERCSNWDVAALCVLSLIVYFLIAVITIFVLLLAGFKTI